MNIQSIFPPFEPPLDGPAPSWAVPLSILNVLPHGRRISVSLYLSSRISPSPEPLTFTDRTRYIKNSGLWEEEYFKPLITHMATTTLKGWPFRIYVAQDVPQKYVEQLVRFGAEVFIMPYDPSWRHQRACLWRYLALEDCPQVITCGADQLALDPIVAKFLPIWQRELGDHLMRWMRPDIGFHEDGKVHYKSLHGGIVCRQMPGITQAMDAWIKASGPPYIGAVPLLGDTDPKSIHHDELFLSHWLYYKTAHSMSTLVARGFNAHEIWRADMAHVASVNEFPTIVYY